jgi:hypothetical protein
MEKGREEPKNELVSFTGSMKGPDLFSNYAKYCVFFLA